MDEGKGKGSDHDNGFDDYSDKDLTLTNHVVYPAGYSGQSHMLERSPNRPLSIISSSASGGVRGVDGQDGSRTGLVTEQPVKFWKKKWFIISQIVIGILGIIMLFVLLFPVVRAIAQHVINVSVLEVSTVSIETPSNGSFNLKMGGRITHTGIFNAKIDFAKPVDVFWVNGDSETRLGTTSLSTISAKNKNAVVNQTTTFKITDEDAFGDFTAHMITQKNFTWRLKSDGLKVQALKFPVAKGLKFNKLITMPGINSFDGGVKLKDFQLPGDDPKGGISFVAVTELENASPFKVDLGTVIFHLFYKDVSLGMGTGPETRIAPGSNTVKLEGALTPRNGTDDLKTISELFTRYMNGESSTVVAQGVSARRPDNTTVSWLSRGIESLKLSVPFKSEALTPIKSIDIGYLNLTFTDGGSEWTPRTSSDDVSATMQLPYGFQVNIDEIFNTFNITLDQKTVATVTTPLGKAQSAIKVHSSTDTGGTINLTISDSPLEIPATSHDIFSSFNAKLTTEKKMDFFLVGRSHAVANTSLGQLTLDPIKFNVSSGLIGLNGLKDSTTIQGVDVMGGTAEGMQLSINVTISNPSNLNLNMGDLAFQLSRDGETIGTVALPDLKLLMGNNSLNARSTFQPEGKAAGTQTLNDFVGGKDVSVEIFGSPESTKIKPLREAIQSLRIGSTLPGLKTKLIESTSLKVLTTTGVQDDIVHVKVNMVNPFSAELAIHDIASDVTTHGIKMGSLSQTVDFRTRPKAVTASPDLNLNLIMDPATVFTVTRLLAIEAGLGTEQLDSIVQLGGIQYLQAGGKKARSLESRQSRSLFTGFNLPNFVDTAFKQLKVDVNLNTSVSVGDYRTTLQYAQTDVPTTTDESLHLLLPILARPIVQKMITASSLGISSVMITNPQQTSFSTQMKGSITNAGPFDAKVSFGGGLQIAWNGKSLGSMKMPDIQLTGDVGAQLDMTGDFVVADGSNLAEFTKAMLTEESFTWDITGENLTISALGIDVSGISLTKKSVTLKGFNSLKDGVKIDSFDLPSNDPAGGIHLTINSTITNPSQVGIQLSAMNFQTFFGSTNLGPASAGQVALLPQASTNIPMTGRLIPQTSAAALAEVSDMFSAFIHGKDSAITVQGDSVGPSDVTWLNEGIKSLRVSTVLPSRGQINVIKSVGLDDMKLLFNANSPYSPSASSSSVVAAFELPFAFPIDLVALEQNIIIGYQGQSFANLAVSKVRSSTDVATRIVRFGFSDIPFSVYGDKHSVFQEFLKATTFSSEQTFSMAGTANSDAQTAIGLLNIQDIAFSVDTTLKGLQGLNAKPTIAKSLDVTHGYPDYLLITVDTSIFNPSNITIGTGDVSFALQFEEQTIGSAQMSNVIITPGDGNYTTSVHFAPQGGAATAGQHLLQNYMQGVDSSTSIMGTMDTTNIDSLKPALADIRLSPVNIPALHQNLIKSTSLKFTPEILTTGIAFVNFVLENPFTASINLLEVTGSAIYEELNLGTIDHVDLSGSPIHADGHSTITSSSLPFKFNLQPLVIIDLLKRLSQRNNVDIGPLTTLFQFITSDPDSKSSVKVTVDESKPTCVSGHQFDVNSAVLKSLAGLAVDLTVDSSVKLDDYATNLQFIQKNVTAITDESALLLIGAVGAPIVQKLVDNATLSFHSANITNLSEDGFDLSLDGALLNSGPLDAQIAFVDPVKVMFQGKQIATIELPPVCAAANDGVPNYRANGRLQISDREAFTDFASYLLHNEEFEWVITTDKLRVSALGTIFDDVSMTKTIGFKGYNGLPGVTVENFKLPSDDPAGGIIIEADSKIPSLSQIGIDLGDVTFDSYYQNTHLGPLSGKGLRLAPETITSAHLSGSIGPQSGDDLNVVGRLFSAYLAGQNETLSVKGSSVKPSGSDQSISWLSTAFQSLTLQVVLPGQKLDVIQSIEIADMNLELLDADQAYSPKVGSKSTVAKYKNPFGFSLQVIEAAQNITLLSHNVAFAQLDLPSVPGSGGVSTGNVVDLNLSFENQVLRSVNNAAFELFLATAADRESAEFELRGTADVIGRTTIGDIPISGIPFDVTSSIKGMNSFGGAASLKDFKITGSGGNGGSEYVSASSLATMNNPSTLSLHTADISLPVYLGDTLLGRANIKDFKVEPGENTVETEFHYQPLNANDTMAQSFLAKFIQTGEDLPVTIRGDDASTSIPSLRTALKGVTLHSSLKGLNFPNLITHVNVFIPLSALTDSIVSVNFDIQNPLDVDLVINHVDSDSGVDGETYAHFSQSFTNFVVPAKGSANSGTFGDVLLTKGALASLGIVPLGAMDVSAGTTVQTGVGGYTVPYLQFAQKHVPVSYTLSLSPSDSEPVAHPNPDFKPSTSSSSAQSSTKSSAPSSSAAETRPSQSSSSQAPAPAPAPPSSSAPPPAAPAPTPSTPSTPPSASPSPSPSPQPTTSSD